MSAADDTAVAVRVTYDGDDAVVEITVADPGVDSVTDTVPIPADGELFHQLMDAVDAILNEGGKL